MVDDRMDPRISSICILFFGGGGVELWIILYVSHVFWGELWLEHRINPGFSSICFSFFGGEL
jgi:hypothetical protein